jgi:hypothetical protein
MNLTKLLEIAEKAGAFLFARKKWLPQLHFTIITLAICTVRRSQIRYQMV